MPAATFRVSRSFCLERSGLFVVSGVIASGEVRAGMYAEIPLNRDFSIQCKIQSIEYVRYCDGEQVALVLAESDVEREFLVALDLADECLVISEVL